MDERIERYLEYLNNKKLELNKKMSEMDDSVEKTILLERYSKIYECEALVRRLEILL